MKVKHRYTGFRMVLNKICLTFRITTLVIRLFGIVLTVDYQVVRPES